MERKLVKTKDGSSSIYLPEMDEHYHSVHGALQEAIHVFINAGLNEVCQNKKKINILEVGFGTGLNALLTLEYATKFDLSVFYCGYEAFPVSIEMINEINYTELNNLSAHKKDYAMMHELTWDIAHRINSNFELIKKQDKIQNIKDVSTYDLIYFDAFGPNSQSEMWDKTVFEPIIQSMTENALFVTYCAKGQVRRDLRDLGLEMERIPGPPGKREMLRGRKV